MGRGVMGLDFKYKGMEEDGWTSDNRPCFSYSGFHQFKNHLAGVAWPRPPKGYYETEDGNVYNWESQFKDDPLHQLVYHSDSSGDLSAQVCGKLADRLEEIPLPDDDFWIEIKATFVKFLRAASKRNEPVIFC